MKKNKKSGKMISTRKMVICVTALLLVFLVALGSTVSWIEEVSEVDFNNTSGQQTPAKIGDRILKSDVISRQRVTNPTDPGPQETDEISTVNLNEFFNESGDMHLSPCYGDGENFYFPINGSNNTFRTGTKDDANVNYLSTTFRVRSLGANTVYWFTKTIVEGRALPYVTFKNGSSPDTSLVKYIRCSVTIDGATNVYTLDDTGTDKTYRTVVNNTVTDKTGRNLEEYCYYDEAHNDTNPVGYYKNSVNKTNKPNQGQGDNLNGNTLFTVNEYDNTAATLKTVTVKIWLECPTSGTTPNTVSGVDVASVNLDFVSAWAKTRRIYLHDVTVNEYDEGINNTHQTTEHWLTKDPLAKLYWAIKDDNETTGYKMISELTRVKDSNDNDTDWYYIDLPAVYNNRECALFRCNSQWNGGNSHEGESVKYWDKWATTFPNTFHSEIFSVYSHKFGTWDQGTINQITVIDSCKFAENDLKPKSYLWDSSTEYGTGTDDKVVMNANWPGEEMTRMAATVGKNTSGGNMNLPTYKTFYTSRFDKGVFNDGAYDKNVNGGRNQLQTQDVWFLNGSTSYVKTYFDMATLHWYSTSDLAQVRYTDTILVNNFNTNGNTWSNIRMIYYTDAYTGDKQGTNDHWYMCKAFIKSPGWYNFMIYHSGHYYGKPDGMERWNMGDQRDMRNIDGHEKAEGYVVNIYVSQEDISSDNRNGVFRFFFDPNSHSFVWHRGEY